MHQLNIICYQKPPVILMIGAKFLVEKLLTHIQNSNAIEKPIQKTKCKEVYYLEH